MATGGPDGGAIALCASVGLETRTFRDRYPHQLSGGQQQRVAIARAMAVRPKADHRRRALVEPRHVGAGADPRPAGQPQGETELGLVLISHDLNVVDAIADRVIVMYLGQVVEAGPTRQVMSSPTQAYTRSLLEARLSIEPRPSPLRATAAAAAIKATPRAGTS